ncbi:Hypothetical protein FKW44_006727 [Caligus rogercresseyi]|uniref:Uncharacterized protein n=1 Tax=Caligus rogercresseyi TaxID=217165 RepID=A0A7T8KDS3_CALRO|nr:Hypothetical protein FKW44_006727 [Caligus rogercresseyi]
MHRSLSTLRANKTTMSSHKGDLWRRPLWPIFSAAVPALTSNPFGRAIPTALLPKRL